VQGADAADPGREQGAVLMAGDKKICPLLSSLSAVESPQGYFPGGKPGFSCLQDRCAWWIANAYQGEVDSTPGWCAVHFLKNTGGD